MPYKIEGTTNTNSELVIIKENDWSVEKTMNISSESAYLANPLVSGTKTVFAKRPDGEVVSYGSVNPVNYSFEYPRSIGNSAVFNDDDGDYLEWIPTGAPDNAKKQTISFWIKPGYSGVQRILATYNDGAENGTIINFLANHSLSIETIISTTSTFRLIPTQLFRDPTSWYHIVIFYDSTPAVPGVSDCGIYVNGTLVTDFTTINYPSQNEELYLLANGKTTRVGKFLSGESTSLMLDSYISEFIVCDGQKYSASDFGEFYNGVWVPKTSLSLTYGTNGFRLDFAQDSPNLGNDISGNTNHFTESGSPEQVTDTPTNNFCTFNSVHVNSALTVSKGNTRIKGGAANTENIYGTMMITIPTYFETQPTINSNGNYFVPILVDVDQDLELLSQPTQYMGRFVRWDAVGNSIYRSEDSGSIADGGITYVQGDIMMVAIDPTDDFKMWFGKNGVWNNQTPGTGGAEWITVPKNVVFMLGLNADPGKTDWTGSVNFGGYNGTDVAATNSDENGYGKFVYTPPAGFHALCSANIAQSLSIIDVLDKPSQAVYVNSRLGTGAEATISDVDFDVSAGAMVTIKNRDQADSWVQSDTERGATKEINWDTPNPQVEKTTAQGIKSFSSSGYVLGTDDKYNTSGENFLDWALREGASYGLDIVSYTGNGANRTIAHSLGVVPSMIIAADLEVAYGIMVYHSLSVTSNPEEYYANTASTAAFSNAANLWNNTLPTASVFSLSSHVTVNTSGEEHIAYLFGDIPGLCKAFTYVGNGDADGPYIPLGFKPAFILTKNETATRSWFIHNSKVKSYNVVGGNSLVLSGNLAEFDGTSDLDILSQGFKPREASSNMNANGERTFGFAWAEQFGPFSNAR